MHTYHLENNIYIVTTQEIAEQLVVMNRDNKHMEIYEALYDPKVVSVEHTGW